MTATTFDRSAFVPFGFAAAVSMWAVAYVLRLPAVTAPSWLLLVAMLAALAVWGFLSGRSAAGGWRLGAASGAVAAVVNMLILGSLLASPDGAGLRPSAAWWVPGSILAAAVIAGGFAAAAGRREGDGDPRRWTTLLASVAVAATFLLVVAGGLVTSNEAGLAVVDWPNTFGSNMFLYPLARMTGGIYYEHAHRLFGALVGLTTVVLAIRLWRRDPRPWLRRLAGLAVVLVIVQGVLGGLRVTGGFTLSTSEADMAPSIALAVAHGVLGQVFLSLIVVVAVATSRRWLDAPAPEARPSAGGDFTLQAVLVAALLVQLVLGAVQRHLAWGLIIHISLAAVVVMVAVIAGARAWGLYHGTRPVQQLGQLLIGTVGVQVALGIAALAVTQGRAIVGSPTIAEVTLATAHQATGAALLALSVALLVWTRRLFFPER
jgi:cytochrome c oxidase assembly protein subunit 15